MDSQDEFEEDPNHADLICLLPIIGPMVVNLGVMKNKAVTVSEVLRIAGMGPSLSDLQITNSLKNLTQAPIGSSQSDLTHRVNQQKAFAEEIG